MSRTLAERAAATVLGAGLIVTAIITTNGDDHFRLPKELVFRAEAIVLLAIAVFWLTERRRTWRLQWRPEFLVAIGIVIWVAITTATSTNRLLSIDSLITVIAAAIIFIATCLVLQDRSFAAIDVVMIGACVNAVIVILQELKIWTPFLPAPEMRTHMGSVGLLGNPNDVGTYLAAPALVAFVVAVMTSGARRRVYAVIVVLLVAGIAASATRTAIGALLAGLIVFGLAHSRRAAIAVCAVVLAFALVPLIPGTSLHKSTRKFIAAMGRRDYRVLMSERLVPFLTAAEMARDHPVTGVGPGCFKYHFMSYRLELTGLRGFPMNWGEVHDDHLQVLAESGVPGYLLFLAALGIVVWRPATSNQQPATAFARALRWPLAVLVFVLCLAQFPLELAAPRLMLLTLGAVCVTWDRDDVES